MNEAKSNTVFQVGDEVSYGFNGDYYPAVVVKVSKGYVETMRLQVVFAPGFSADTRGNYLTRETPGVIGFERTPVTQIQRFTRKANGRFGLRGCKNSWLLTHGAVSAFNPHF